MRVRTNDREFAVHVAHRPEHRMTYVCITDEQQKIVATDAAIAHPNDVYSKAAGRRIAFARAVAQMPIDRAGRSAFWEAARRQGWKGVR